jgi:hypothetical protein
MMCYTSKIPRFNFPKNGQRYSGIEILAFLLMIAFPARPSSFVP